MYLKKLEMQGFKSFVDKISLDFGEGITAIVGPNGSGKSNISDAIRWVMGEQSIKSLRGSKMEDVIFSGTEKRKPTGFAQVTLLLDNSTKIFPIDYEEISVTRRVFRSGESEYLINKAVCRLKDIHELFMDTGLGRDGYSIIGQGRIDEILSTRSEDRRQIFEEAAGISKYKYKKTEAQRRLAVTQENLERANDIAAELEARIGPLEAQSKKAAKYLHMRDELKLLDVSLAAETISKLKVSSDEIAISFQNAKEAAAAAAVKLKELQDEEEKQYALMRETEGSLTQIRESLHNTQMLNEKTQGEISVIESTVSALQNDIKRYTVEIAATEKAVKDGGASFEEIDKKIDLLEQKRRDKLSEIDSLSAALEKHSAETDKQNEDLARLTEEKNEKMRAGDLIKNKIETVDTLEDNAEERFAVLEENIQKSKQSIAKGGGELDLIAQGIAAAQKELDTLRQDQAEKTQRAKNLQGEIEGLKTLYNEKSDEHNKAMSRLTVLRDMEKNFEGYGAGVRSLLSSDIVKKITCHGVLSKLISVEERFSVAVEVALGNALQNVVVENEDDAKKAIEYLKMGKLGRVTFLPVSSVRGKRGGFDSDCKSEKGYMGLVSDRVEADEKYRQILENLLGQTALFDNMDNAVAAARKFGYRFKIVTLTGEVLFAGGSITGGSTARFSRLLGRDKEIAELSDLDRRLSAQMDKTEEKIDEKSEGLRDLTKALTALNEDEQKKSGEILKLLSDKDLRTHILSREKDGLFERENELKLLKEASLHSEKERGRLTTELNQTLQALEGLEEGIAKQKESLRETIKAKEAINNEIIEKRMEISALNGEIDLQKMRKDSLLSDSAQKKEQIQRLEGFIAELKGKIDENHIIAEEKRESIAKELERAKEFSGAIAEMDDKKSGADALVIQLKTQVREQNETVTALNLECARLESKIEKASEQLEAITSRLWEEYEITLSQAMQLKADIGNLAEARKRANELKSGIKALGHINIDAIEEYKEVKERYDFLSGQINDLVAAREELLALISEMTKCMTTQFATQFEIINENFGHVFRELFGGGSAALTLTDPTNILESGIEIDVRPPGKKLQRLSLLSGGEMAFTAIALLFAILKVRPTPFCILDEIEAALDDNNIDRFGSYIKKFSSRTQFIIVTHRRGTMAAADVLYGVTMQEKGVSKLLTMRLSELEEKATVS